jgi:hypothetical protein
MLFGKSCSLYLRRWRWKFSAATNTQTTPSKKRPEVENIPTEGVFHRLACPKTEPTDQKMPQLPSAASTEILKLLQPRISSSPLNGHLPGIPRSESARLNEGQKPRIKHLVKSLKARLQPIVSLPSPYPKSVDVFSVHKTPEAAMIGAVPSKSSRYSFPTRCMAGMSDLTSYDNCIWNGTLGLEK